MGMKFRFRRTKCTGRYRDKPLVEVRWTTEEGDYCLDDLIAGDLGSELTTKLAIGGNGNGEGNGNGNGNGNSSPPVPFSNAPVMHRTVVNVDLTVPPSRNNASAIRQVSTQAKPSLPAEPDDPPGILNKIV
ncbi:hypothetical protein [Desulfovibrio ferrophilus]|uniref:Uncharacterized protein n=1 Tax=Desulfovibrio ferrophilus TaxID=241368 RepID=A0A2Z6AU45_9BACT|nr:hypothetical protein [Desulfovibrio ferrophilus]BBD06754.1 uncharacterized protein DFE_0028 [Desulfovibrio ferrophilus]